MRVISSPSNSTTGFTTLILAILQNVLKIWLKGKESMLIEIIIHLFYKDFYGNWLI